MEANKAKLEAIQAKQPEKWTIQLQAKLDETIGEIADIDEEIAALAEEVANAEKPEEVTNTEKPEYTPSKGTEKLVHLSIVRGRRFNPMTGKEESTPYIQMFTYGEFQLFKKNANLLGYLVLKVLHDPYGEANEMVTK